MCMLQSRADCSKAVVFSDIYQKYVMYEDLSNQLNGIELYSNSVVKSSEIQQEVNQNRHFKN